MVTAEQRISCIVCPMSCEGTVHFENGQIKEVTGFSCQRGMNYAREEVTAPKRTLTTTVRVIGGVLPLLPVISKTALPKEKVLSSAHCLSTVTVQAPIAEGDIIYHNILNLGVDIVATRAIERI